MPVTLPPAPSKVIFTGPIGPGNSLSSYSIPNVRQANFQFDRGVLEVALTTPTGMYIPLALDGISTITVSIASDVATITCS